jgi:RNA polymerase sigma-70 factor (ECF subfamily)
VLACGTGDLDGLLDMLADDVVVWTDGGGLVRAALRPVVGPFRSSRFLLNVARKGQGVPQEAMLNGQPAMVFMTDGQVVSALVLDIVGGQIAAVRVVSNPEKLERLSRQLAAAG